MMYWGCAMGTDYYMRPTATPGGNGLLWTTAFNWAEFKTWAETAALADDVLYVETGEYTAASSIASGRNGSNTQPITIIGVTDLTLTEAEWDEFPYFNFTAGNNFAVNNYWDIRNIRFSSDTNPTVLIDRNSIMRHCQIDQSGVGYAVSLGTTGACLYDCRVTAPAGHGVSMAAYTRAIGNVVNAVGDCIRWAGNDYILVASNVLVGGANGVNCGARDMSTVINNTIYDCAVGISGTNAYSIWIFRNLIDSCTIGVEWTTSTSTNIMDWNGWNNATDIAAGSGMAKGPHAVTGVPNFVDAAGGDFRVQNTDMIGIGILPATIGAVDDLGYGAGYAAGDTAGQATGYTAGQASLAVASSVDMSTDHYQLDGLEQVMLDGNDTPHVYRHRLVQSENEPTEGVYLSRNVQWDFPPDVLTTPNVGGIIEDTDGNSYVILTVSPPYTGTTTGDYFGCQCRDFIIADTYSLDNTVTWYPGVDTTDEYGSKITAHNDASAAFTDIPAKIMLRQSSPEEYAGQKEYVEKYDIYVNEDIGQLNNGDMLKDESLKNYVIISYRNRDRIEELSVLECEFRPLKT